MAGNFAAHFNTTNRSSNQEDLLLVALGASQSQEGTAFTPASEPFSQFANGPSDSLMLPEDHPDDIYDVDLSTLNDEQIQDLMKPSADFQSYDNDYSMQDDPQPFRYHAMVQGTYGD